MPRFIDISAGATPIAAAETARAALAAVGKSELVENVLDYGAVGDGATDDTDAINSAIEAASGSTGTVLLPAGYNFLVTTLVPLSDVTITGYGATLTKDGSGIKEIITNRGDFTPFSNFKVYGVTFVGEGQSYGDTSISTSERRQAIALYDCTNVTVQDCSASDFAYGGFAFTNAVGVRIVNNTLTNCGKAPLGNAIHVGYAGSSPSQSFDTVITGNTVTGCETGACVIQGSYTNPSSFPALTHIHHNNFTCSSFAAIALEIGNSGASTSGITIRRVMIDHNFCTQTAAAGSGTYGISVSDNNGGSFSTDADEFLSIIIDHNTIQSSDAGILSTASDTIIDSNIINSTAGAIRVLSNTANTPTDTVVSNNFIPMPTGSTGHAMFIASVASPTICNNKIFWPDTGVTATTAGINVVNCTMPVVRDNEVLWAPSHGVIFSGCSDVRCQGNLVYNVNSQGALGGNGIQWVNSGDYGEKNLFVGNTIVDDRATTSQNYPFNNASANNGNLHLINNRFYATSRNYYNGTAPVESPVTVPSTATSTGVQGQWAASSTYLYVCTAANTWKRVAISTW